jgi:hypothetical protein
LINNRLHKLLSKVSRFNNILNIHSQFHNRPHKSNLCKDHNRLISSLGVNQFNLQFAQEYYVEAVALALTHIGDIARCAAVKI